MELSNSVYVIITTHGLSQIDPFSSDRQLKTFEIPEGINILNIMASPIGVVNTICYKNLNAFASIISNGFENLSDEIKDNIGDISVLAPVVEDIQQKLKQEDKQVLRNSYIRNESDPQLIDMQYTWDNRYNMDYHTSDNDMLNKRFSIDIKEEKVYWLDNKIQVFNLPNQDEDLDLLDAFIQENPSKFTEHISLNMNTIIDFLKSKGVINIVIFDFSCSTFNQDIGIKERERRDLRRNFTKSNTKSRQERMHPYTRKKQLAGRKKTVNKTRKNKHKHSKYSKNKHKHSKYKKNKHKHSKHKYKHSKYSKNKHSKHSKNKTKLNKTT